MSVRIEGLEALLRRADARRLLGKPLADFWQRCAIAVQGEARKAAPVDTGQLRNSLEYEVDNAGPPLWAKVGLLGAAAGSPLWYKGRAMEYGTGSQGDPAVSHKTGHWPPAGALDVWGRRHGGLSGGQVARAIGRAGGVKPHPYLRPGLAASINSIRGFVSRLGDDIQARWGSG